MPSVSTITRNYYFKISHEHKYGDGRVHDHEYEISVEHISKVANDELSANVNMWLGRINDKYIRFSGSELIPIDLANVVDVQKEESEKIRRQLADPLSTLTDQKDLDANEANLAYWLFKSLPIGTVRSVTLQDVHEGPDLYKYEEI